MKGEKQEVNIKKEDGERRMVKGERPEVNIKKRMVKGGWGKVKGERSEVKDKQ